MSNYIQLKQNLKNLSLTGIIDVVELRIKQAEESQLAYSELLCMLLDDELELRRNRKIQRLMTSARLKANKTLESFEFKANPSINAVQIRELFTLRFIERSENVFFIGPTGVGKTHLAQALAHQACRKNLSVLFFSFVNLLSEITKAEISGKIDNLLKQIYKPDLLIIDEFAFKKISSEAAEYFYSIVEERYQAKSIVFTANRAIVDWMEIFPDQVMANAILDRIAHNAHQIIITGESYRKRNLPAK